MGFARRWHISVELASMSGETEESMVFRGVIPSFQGALRPVRSGGDGVQVKEDKMACAGARIEFTPSGKSMITLISEINEMDEA